MSHWTAKDIPNLEGKTVLVTGANSGLGYWSSYYLAKQGAHVLMACRNQKKADTAKSQILKEVPMAKLTLMTLDLSDLSQIRSCAEQVLENHQSLDILLNNAGVMFLPEQKTKDGFEIHFGTNHLGHFALTGHLIDLLKNTPESRIVTVSSIAHRQGKMRFDDLHFEKQGYKAIPVYCQSKLANLLFAFELQRKLTAAGLTHPISLAAHPGYSDTNLQYAGPEQENSFFKKMFMKVGNALMSQPANQGALPQLYAATSPQAQAGKYYGPDKMNGMKGYPTQEDPKPQAKNEADAKQLWDISEELTGVKYNL